MIKSVTEEDASSGDLTIQIILNDKGMVVAHSIVDEIGHDYSQETGTMGAEILKKIETDNEEYFHLNYGGVKYLVYVDPISNGWYSISVTDTTKSYSGLNRSVIMAIIVIVAIIMILSTVFLRSNQRNILAQRLNKQLATSANIYMSVVYVDIIKDKCERIKSSKAAADLKSESARWGAQKTFRRVLGTISDNPTKDKLMTFVDLSTLDERFTDTDDISMEFIGYCLSLRRALTLKVPFRSLVISTACTQIESKSSFGISTAGHTLCTPKTFVTRLMHSSRSENPRTKIRPSWTHTSAPRPRTA